MNVWKLQCYFCGDTVSTGQLNQQFYKMHLEVVHSVLNNSEGLLNWTLSQQNVGETVPEEATSASKKGIIIQRSWSLSSSSPEESCIQSPNLEESWNRSPNLGNSLPISSTPKSSVPRTLFNMKGITVCRVKECIKDTLQQKQQMKVREEAERSKKLTAAKIRQQEQAITQWANGCEHGCRICRKNGINFRSFTKQGLLKHLMTEHDLSERDYKEEFSKLITRVSNTTCKECGARIKRTPASLNIHLKKHGLNIKTYWVKHLQPHNLAAGTGRGSIQKGPRGILMGKARPVLGELPSPHRSRHSGGIGQSAVDDVGVLNKGATVEHGGNEGGDKVMDIDPTDMLEVVIGDEVEEDLLKEVFEDERTGDLAEGDSVNRPCISDNPQKENETSDINPDIS